jgi:hypothetical protein
MRVAHVSRRSSLTDVIPEVILTPRLAKDTGIPRALINTFSLSASVGHM